MDQRVKIFTLGGLDEDGKNCLIVEVDNDIYVIEAGVKYPDKTMPGIDYIIPDFTYLKSNKHRVKAYILLHGHVDEFGALPYIYNEVPAPVYGSEVTYQMLKLFLKDHNFKNLNIKFNVVKPTDKAMIEGRLFQFFSTAHNIAKSSGVAISTTMGNVIVTGDFVIENGADPNYLFDMNSIATIAEHKTLVLITESTYANHPGYTAPSYKLTPYIEEEIRNSKGRVFVSLFISNFYNIDEVIKVAIKCHKKIVPYDEASSSVIKAMQEVGQLLIPRENFAPTEDLNRLRDQDIVVLILGQGSKLYNTIALLAAGQNETRKCYLTPTDTFINASPANDNTEIEATDALDELYRSGATIINVPRKKFLRMHASEEDLKMMITLVKPQYYIPVKGFYKDLLKNAEVALSMGINLNHQNVFLLENGLPVIFENGRARMVEEDIPHADVMIDGISVGDISREVLQEREKLGQGLIICGACYDASTHKLIGQADLVLKGLTYLKENETLIREINKQLAICNQEYMDNKQMDIEDQKSAVHDKIRRTVYRMTGKEPSIIPLLEEI